VVLNQKKPPKGNKMPLDKKERLELVLDGMKLIQLIAQMSKDGWSKEEKEELLKALRKFSLKLAVDALD
jgi:hypothetical protein